MRKSDLLSSGIVFCLALCAFIETRKFHIGSLSEPKEGLFPFILSLTLGGLSIVGFIIAYTGRSQAASTEENGEIIWKKLLSYIVALVAYAFLFDVLGYLISSLIVLFFILRVAEGVGWMKSLVVTVCTLIISYVVFDVLLLVPLPKGIFGQP